MFAIPPFDADGLLPPGDYEVTFDELRASILVTGPNNGKNSWDVAWRLHLIGNLETLTRQLWQIGISQIFADGSFAEDKDHPNDIDGYFDCSLDLIRTGELTRQLNRLDAFKVWTWALQRGGPTVAIPRGNYPCGIATGLSSIRTSQDSVLAAAYEISSAMSWSFLRRSGNRDEMANLEAS